jgi:hypothetical protein
MEHHAHRITLVAALLLALLLVAVAASAGDRGRSLTITAGENGDQLEVVVSRALAMTVLNEVVGSTLSCDGAVDSEFRALLQRLDAGGRGTRATLREDGSVIEARRRAHTVKLDIHDLEGGGKIEVVMPWAVADCVLGRDVTLDSSARKIKVKIKGAEGGSFEFKVK